LKLIIIVGAGIAGLAAAYELSRRHVPFTVLEASSRAGGLILTEYTQGFTIEAGPDSILAQKPAAIDLCRDLGLGADLVSTTPPRTAFVLKDHRLHPLPSPSVLGVPTSLGGIARCGLLSAAGRARVALEPIVPKRPPSDESVASFFMRRFGAETVDAIAQPLLGGIHSGDVGRLSMRSLFPDLAAIEARGASMLHAFRGRQPSPDGLFRSFGRGMIALADGVRSRLPQGSIRTDTRVERLQRLGNEWEVSTAAGVERGRAAILCVPAPAIAAIVRGVDSGIARRLEEIPYTSSVGVTLAWPRDAIAHPLNGSGFVVARSAGAPRLTACTWVSSKWEGRAPEGVALLRAFIGGAHDPSAVDVEDDELIALAARELAQTLRIRGTPVLTRVHRWRRASPQHEVGHPARVADVEAMLAGHTGLFVAGSGLRVTGIPDCIADGRAAAAAADDYVKGG
jgi:oxygen-dependent protoporphyrinogen oxidase